MDIWTHSNETLATVRRRILARVKAANQTSALTAANTPVVQPQTQPQQQQQQQIMTAQQQQQQHQQQSNIVKLDLYLNGELIEPSEGYRLVSELSLRDKTVSWSRLYIVHSTCW